MGSSQITRFLQDKPWHVAFDGIVCGSFTLGLFAAVTSGAVRAKATGTGTGDESDFEPVPLTNRRSQKSSFPSPCPSPRQKALKAQHHRRCCDDISPRRLPFAAGPPRQGAASPPAAGRPPSRGTGGRCHGQGEPWSVSASARAAGAPGCSVRPVPLWELPVGAAREERGSPGQAAPGRDGNKVGTARCHRPLRGLLAGLGARTLSVYF